MRIIEYIPDPFITALAWSLLHSLWQILAIAVLWQLSLWFARRAPAMARQNLSIFALLTIPVVFIITFMKQYSIYSKVQKIAFLEFETSSLQSIEATRSLYILQKENTSISQMLEGYSPLIFWLYWAGIALFSLYFIFSYGRLLHIKKNKLTSPPQAWSTVIASSRLKTRIGINIPVWLSQGVSVPVVIGFFKPIILLPLGLSASLTMREAEDILLHEMYHIRCKDHYINAMQYLFEILFFYHPCTWWISQTLRSQRESKVDEWVVMQTRNPLKYAQTLLSLEEKRIVNLKPAMAATSSQKTLLNRIKNIMLMKTRNFKPGQKIAAIMVIAFATLSLAWLNPPAVFLGFADYPEKNEPIEQTIPEEPVASFTTQEVVTEPTPQPAQPSRIVLEDGESISWDELSDEDKAEISQALKEAQLAIREAMQEVQKEFNSEEFKAEMREAKEEINRAMQEVSAELHSEEFREELRRDIEEALEEVNAELSSDEFKQEMQQAREEIRMAMIEASKALEDEEFKAEMKQVGVELQRALGELDSLNWSQMGVDLNFIFQEVGKSMEIIGPTINEILQGIELDTIMETEEIETESEQI